MTDFPRTDTCVIVAHPDDEALWCGGLLLMRPQWRSRIVSLCRASDPDRAPKFRRALEFFGAEGDIGDMDDGPEQHGLPGEQTRNAILALLPERKFDRILTHSPFGEYTRHRRHEEIGRAVLELWRGGALRVDEVWMFAYEDGGRVYFPQAIAGAHETQRLPIDIWRKKYHTITQIYRFAPDSWEAQAIPRTEGFWRFTDPRAAIRWMEEKESRP